MDYKEAKQYISEIPRFAHKTTRENVRQLFHILEDPHRNQKIIHVAGTNGKGSTCAYLERQLRKCGKNVLLFTSPHLVCIRERIQWNGEWISKEDFTRSCQRVIQATKQLIMKGGSHPSFFEFLFAMAMILAKEKQADWCVIEAGMGGEKDATNILMPQAAVLTSVSVEHTQYLGNTIEEIAEEKAGIIKHGTTVITPQFADPVRAAIEAKVCREKADWHEVASLDRTMYHFPSLYQYQNAALAVEVMQCLGFPVDYDALQQTVWEGRMEEVCPGFYVDGAHNMEAVEKLLQTLDTCYSKQNKVLLFSVVEDKAYEEMIALLTGKDRFQKVILTRLPQTRGVSTEQLAISFSNQTDAMIIAKPEIEKALQLALQETKQGNMVVATGSLYLVGEIKKLLGGYDD
ncbi:MAG: bifunctional folylpolyglutamate synthase/dihydrofolate synthase [Lachnospiraceae bacterium]